MQIRLLVHISHTMRRARRVSEPTRNEAPQTSNRDQRVLQSSPYLYSPVASVCYSYFRCPALGAKTSYQTNLPKRNIFWNRASITFRESITLRIASSAACKESGFIKYVCGRYCYHQQRSSRGYGNSFPTERQERLLMNGYA